MKTGLRILFCVLFAMAADGRASAEDARDAVVKIFVTANKMDFYRPWQSKGIRAGTGSGCVIAGNRILTNAHVVADSTFIQVRKESDPRKYTARLEAVGHDCDLAILSVEDPEFFKGIRALEFGALPSLQDAVTALGYPAGGDKLSITEGVVSRVEIIPYTQSSKKLLAVQIDAAINPGNSGGPVIKDGKLIGVAMQVMTNSQNIGYMIPTPIIDHFLKDWEDGQYGGFPSLGIDFHNTENKTLRAYYSLDQQNGGVLVTRVYPYSPAADELREGDVILALDGVPIAVDGTFEFRKGERLELSYLIDRNPAGHTIDISLIRQGKPEKKSILLKSYAGLVAPPNSFKEPPYFIYGGLVFTVLSNDLLESWGAPWWEKAPIDFLNYLMGKGRLNPGERKEIVVLLEVLPDDINVGYHTYSNEVLARVNGENFKSFEEFVKLLNNNSQPYTIFETDQNARIILRNEGVGDATRKILLRNHIPSQYSTGVAAWLAQ
ncbi:MAG: serine protease [Candidatus Omnitrophota bacterium]|nr:serine protease [Candidatus Omnitrophota bacterium]MDZ4242445.1 serine protease [Candidatus Omnitrophota bacterium]